MKTKRHCEVRSNLYIGQAAIQIRSVQFKDCFVPRNDVALNSLINI